MKRTLFLFIFILLTISLNAQKTFAWGIKGGPLIGLQKWESLQRDPLFKYQGSLFIESVPEDNTFSLFAQGGYHIKGSALRNQRYFFTNGDLFTPSTTEFLFRNASVVLGAKQKFDFGLTGTSYYSFGLRADYTLSTNLDDYKSGGNIVSLSFPADGFVKKFNYGVTVGGGLEFPINELVGTVIELTLNPDLSFQYRQPPLNNVTSPYNPGQNINISERRIVNVTLELSVGFRFLRKVEYID